MTISTCTREWASVLCLVRAYRISAELLSLSAPHTRSTGPRQDKPLSSYCRCLNLRCSVVRRQAKSQLQARQSVFESETRKPCMEKGNLNPNKKNIRRNNRIERRMVRPREAPGCRGPEAAELSRSFCKGHGDLIIT